MDKLISNKLTVYFLVSVSMFVLFTASYTTIGENNNNWWIADKLNDRIFAINLLLISSFCFQDTVYKAFSKLNIGYVAILAIYEVLFIYNKSNPESFSISTQCYSILSYSYLVIGFLLLLFLTYVSKRNRRRN